MTDFFQILQREEETKKSPEKNSPIDIEENNNQNPKITEPDIEPDSNIEAEPRRPRGKRPIYIPPTSAKKLRYKKSTLLSKYMPNPIWLNIAEAAKVGGVQPKTIRRAIKDRDNIIRYKISQNRYLIDLKTLILYLHNSRKLKNKLDQNGIGQYVKEWRS